MGPIWFIAIATGLSVVAVTALARRVRGPWAGVVAAAPITPTASLLFLDVRGDALRGIPVIAWTIVAALLLTLWAGGRRKAAGGVALAAALLAWHMSVLVALAVIISGTAATLCVRPVRQAPRERRHLRAWVRFMIGFACIIAVWALAMAVPGAAPFLMLAPWLYAAGVAASWLDSGIASAGEVARGGTIGAVGVVAFAYAVHVARGSLWATAVEAWLMYLGVVTLLAVVVHEWTAQASMPGRAVVSRQ